MNINCFETKWHFLCSHMAAILFPTPHMLQWQKPHTFHSTLLPNPRLPLTATFSFNHETHQDTQPQHLTPTNWSFQQRMEEALDILEIMETQNMTPDPNLFCILLKSCADEQNLELGKIFHSKIVGTKYEKDVYVVNNLINLYAKCGRLETARQLFDKMPVRNAVSWTSVISMYSQNGLHDKALGLFSLMRRDLVVRPNVFTYTIALNACAKLKRLKMGVEIHEDLVKDGCDGDEFIVTALIDMYSKCGRIDDARKVFDKVKEPTVPAWTAIIDGCTNNDRAREAISLIRKVLGLGLDTRTVKEIGFKCMIRACSLGAAFRQGQEIQAHMIKFGYGFEGVPTLTAFVELYERCNRMVLARCLFDQLVVKTVTLWEKMMSGYVRNGMNREAFELYVQMVHDSVELNSSVLSWALRACLALGRYGSRQGKEIHGRAIKVGYRLDEFLVDSLAML